MILALLLFSASATIFKSFDLGLDPADIGYPTGWFTNTIDLSSNNAGNSVTITINCNVYADIHPGATVTLTLPGFTTTTYTTTVPVFQSQMYDNTFVFSSVRLPSPTVTTAYGPISLVVSSAGVNGDILASNVAFGSIAVVPAVTVTDSGLTVSYTTTTSSQVVQALTSIDFNVTTSVNLNMYDYIIITVPAGWNFTNTGNVSWTNPSASGTQYFNTTHVTYSPENRLIGIYGLSTNVSSPVISFTLVGISNPPSIPSTNPTWYLEIFRFGTHTSLVRYSAAGPDRSILKPGNVTVSAWGPANSYSPSTIVSGETIYTALTFTSAHAIPAGATFAVTYGSTVTLTSNYLGDNTQAFSALADSGVYALFTPNNYFTVASPVSKTVSSTVRVGVSIPAGTQIILYNLISFSAGVSATVDAITIKDSQARTIDSLFSAFTLTYALDASNKILSADPKISFTADTLGSPINTIATASVGVLVSFPVPAELSASTFIYINGPFSTFTTLQENTIAFGSTARGIQYNTTESYPSLYTSNSTALVTPSVGSNGLTFKNPVAVSLASYLNAIIYAGSTQGTFGTSFLPIFPSNLWTRYEISVTFTANSINYLYTKPLTIVKTVFSSLTLTGICPGGSDDGNLVQLNFTTPFTSYSPTSSATAYITFEFNTNGLPDDLGSGLANYTAYPATGLGSNTLTLITISSIPNLFYNFSTAVTSIQQSLVFPFYLTEQYDSFTVLATLNVLRQDGSSYTLLSSSSTLNVNDADLSFSLVTGTLTPLTPTVSTSVTSLTFTVPTPTSWINSAVILFDHGSSISSSTLNVGSAASLTFFTSTSVDYIYQTAYATFTNTTAGGSWTLTGFTTPYFYSGEESIRIIGTQGFSSSPKCPLSIEIPYYNNPGSLSFTSVSPTTATALGATSQVINVTLTLATTATVKGSSSTNIFVKLASNFTNFVGSTYKVTLGTFSATGNTATTFTTSAITSDKPSGPLVVYLYNLPVPTLESGTSAIAIITNVTIEYGGDYVYSYNQTTITNPSNALTTFSAGVAAGLTTSPSALVFPNTIGVTEAYLQVKFTTPVFLPQGTVLTYTSNATLIYPDNNIKSNTWFTGGFTSVSLTSSYTIVVTTRSPIAAGALVELRKDQALPVTSGQYGVSFTILATITVGGTTTNLINDIYGVNVTFNSTPSGTISSPAVTLSVTNQGEISDYNLTFT